MELQGGTSSEASSRPLDGLPTEVTVAGVKLEIAPFKTARDAAQRYAERTGFKYDPVKTYAKVDPERATRIAAEYEAMKHDPQNPEVKAAYRAMIDETVAQWEVIKETGLKISFIDFAKDGDPYAASPRLATEDVRKNNHLWVFPTDAGFGSSDLDVSDNPLLEKTKVVIGGRTLLANDVFRIVHDYFGHVKEGVGFRADGEENAWRSHASMYSPLARRAMTSETRGQNSWVNYGPHGEKNRKANGADTIFADQKTGLMPEWVAQEGRYDSKSKKKKAEAKTLYVQRKLLNVEEFTAWAKGQGFATVMQDIHVTLAYSKVEVDWTTLTPDTTPLTSTGGERHLEALGDDGEAKVLRFEDDALEARWQALKDAGCHWKYDAYKPHLTISWDADDLDLTTLEPYTGKLEFGPEIFSELKDDWKATIVEKMDLFSVFKWDEDKHPRDAIGRFAAGDGESISGDNFKYGKIVDDPRAVDPLHLQHVIGGYSSVTSHIDRDGWDKLPDEYKTPAMRQAVDTIADTYRAAATTKSGLGVIKDYTGASSTAINRLADNDAKNPEMLIGRPAYELTTLDTMFDKVKPLETPLMVFRGVSGKRTVMDAYQHMAADDFAEAGKKLIGQVYTENNYISTSFSFGKADDFSSGRTILQITLPKGSKVLVPGQVSAHPREYEAIIKRGSKFKITGVSYTGGPRVKMKSKVLHVTLLEDDSQSIAKCDIAAIFKANPYHDARGRFTFADGEDTPGWGNLNQGVKFVSIGDKFTSSVAKMKEAHRAEMEKQKAKAVVPQIDKIKRLVDYVSSGERTYSLEMWEAQKDGAGISDGTRHAVERMEATFQAVQADPGREAAIVDYTGSHSRKMNMMLGDEETGTDVIGPAAAVGFDMDTVRGWDRNIQQLDATFKDITPSTSAMELYRGASLRRMEGLAINTVVTDNNGNDRTYTRSLNRDEFQQAIKDGGLVGQVFQEAGFMSTSMELGTATGFKDDGYLLNIRAPAGTKMLIPGAFSQHTEEFEVILDRGSRMKIVGARLGAEGKLYGRKILDVELLPPVAKPGRPTYGGVVKPAAGYDADGFLTKPITDYDKVLGSVKDGLRLPMPKDNPGWLAPKDIARINGKTGKLPQWMWEGQTPTPDDSFKWLKKNPMMPTGPMSLAVWKKHVLNASKLNPNAKVKQASVKTLKTAALTLVGRTLAQVFKYNPYHDEWGRFTTSEDAITARQTPQSIAKTLTGVRAKANPEYLKKADEIDARMKTLPHTVHDPKIFKNGVYTPERQKLHDKIINEALREMDKKMPAPGEKPTLVILGGRGGSGKGSFTNGTVNEFDASKLYVLDPDHLKAQLPGYEGWNAAQYHEESSHLADAITLRAISKGTNMLLDVTMKTLPSTEQVVKTFAAYGYHMEGHYMQLPAGKAAIRALGRAFGKEGGRYVPLDVILSNVNNEANFNALKKYFKKWSFYTNDVPKGAKPKLKARSKK